MIRDIRPTDNPEVVVAHGQLFDLEKVLDVGEALIRTFVKEASAIAHDLPDECREFGAEEWSSLGDVAFFRMKTAFMLLKSGKEGIDVGTPEFRVRTGPFILQFCPLGGEGLYLKNGGRYETGACGPGREIDPSPKISVLARCGIPGFLSATGAILALEILEPFFGRGVERYGPGSESGHQPTMIFLRFSHEEFGAGEGDIRIDCTDTT